MIKTLTTLGTIFCSFVKLVCDSRFEHCMLFGGDSNNRILMHRFLVTNYTTTTWPSFYGNIWHMSACVVSYHTPIDWRPSNDFVSTDYCQLCSQVDEWTQSVVETTPHSITQPLRMKHSYKDSLWCWPHVVTHSQIEDWFNIYVTRGSDFIWLISIYNLSLYTAT